MPLSRHPRINRRDRLAFQPNANGPSRGVLRPSCQRDIACTVGDGTPGQLSGLATVPNRGPFCRTGCGGADRRASALPGAGSYSHRAHSRCPPQNQAGRWGGIPRSRSGRSAGWGTGQAKGYDCRNATRRQAMKMPDARGAGPKSEWRNRECGATIPASFCTLADAQQEKPATRRRPCRGEPAGPK